MAIEATPIAAPPRAPAVIRETAGTTETATQRLTRKHIPAWVASGAVHVALIATLILLDQAFAKPALPPESDAQLTIVDDDRPEVDPDKNLVNDDIGLDPELPTATDAAKLDAISVETAVVSNDPPGIETATSNVKLDVIAPAGLGEMNAPGNAGDFGNVMVGGGANGFGAVANPGFIGRDAASKSLLVAQCGGNEKSEAAVARGLAWLAKQQKADGSWQFDKTNHGAAATAMALLPFLAAGQTHKVSKDNKYLKTVDAGLKALLKMQRPGGEFPGGMYAHAIATVALSEALGMSGDKSLLQTPAQKAVNYIVAAQGDDGGWRYAPKAAAGDTSVVGWQIQALQSAKLCKELTVPKETFVGARKFLDKVSGGSNKSEYGYTGEQKGRLSMTAVGLLCRYYLDGWGPNHPGMAAGMQVLLKGHAPGKGMHDMYYYYYATQVAHFFDGPTWHADWNPLMRDLLIDSQVAVGKPENGSWEASPDHTGRTTGRLGTTCLSLLTLEVYYRHLPLYKRDAAGLKELERAK